MDALQKAWGKAKARPKLVVVLGTLLLIVLAWPLWVPTAVGCAPASVQKAMLHSLFEDVDLARNYEERRSSANRLLRVMGRGSLEERLNKRNDPLAVWVLALSGDRPTKELIRRRVLAQAGKGLAPEIDAAIAARLLTVDELLHLYDSAANEGAKHGLVYLVIDLNEEKYREAAVRHAADFPNGGSLRKEYVTQFLQRTRGN